MNGRIPGWLRSPRAFAAEIHRPLKFLRGIARAVEGSYLDPWFRTRGPGRPVRRIDRPNDRLKAVQKKISEVLARRMSFGEFIHGGLKGRCPKTLAAHHRGKAVVVKIDIADFFPSISSGRVESLLRERLGASRQVARLVSRLLTRRRLEGVGSSTFLPQGSPASTLIANIALMTFDEIINGAAKRVGVRYDRYVDDIVLSGDRARELIPVVVGQLGREGFKPARRKLDVMPRGKSQVAVGLNLQMKLSPARKFRDGCAELLAQLKHCSPEDRLGLEARLAGKLSYARACEGSFSRRLEVRSQHLLLGIQTIPDDTP